MPLSMDKRTDQRDAMRSHQGGSSYGVGRGIVDWQDNDEVQRQMRRDIKRELRDAGGLSEDQLE